MVVPQTTPNPRAQYTTLPAQGPSPCYYVSPTNAAFKNHQPATYMLPPYSQVAYIPIQQMYPSTYMVPGQIIPQQYMSSQQPSYVQQPQQMSIQSNESTTTQNIDSSVSQEPITIQDTPTQNPPLQNESSTPFIRNSTMPIPSENDTSIIDVSFTSNSTPQVPATIVSPITTTTANNSHIEAHGVDASTEKTYELANASVVNDVVKTED